MGSALVNDKTTPPTAAEQQPTDHLLVEQIQPHFNHFQFFFDSSHIRHLAGSDRRFLQRIFREKSHFNVNAFFTIDCEEEVDLAGKFHELYDAILEANGSAIRAYQLVVNSLTYFYSRLTWATSVQKYVTQFLVDSLPTNFQETDCGQRSLFALELACLLELFVLCYAAECERVNEDTIVQLLENIRKTGGEEHLSAFVNVHLINHFGCSLELRLRRIVERLDLRVKALRDPPPFSLSSAGVGRPKLSLNMSESMSRGGRSGSSMKGTSSELVPSDASTDSDMEGEGKTETAKVAIGTGRRHQQQPQRQHHQQQRRRQQQRDGHSSSVSIEVKGKEEEQDNDDDEAGEEAKEGHQRTPSPPAKRLRSGSSAVAVTSKKSGRRGSRRRTNLIIDDTSEESNGSSSSSNGAAKTTTAGAAAVAEYCSPLAATTPNFPITRSATAHASAAASCSSRSSSSTTTTASTRTRRTTAVLTKLRTTKIVRSEVDKSPPKSSVPSRAKHSMASVDVRVGHRVMFRKPTRKHNLRRPTADQQKDKQNDDDEEDEEDMDEVESRIQDVLEAQKVRQRRSGMDAVECAVGKDLAREFHRLDENPFQMHGGAMLRLSDHQKAALSAADIEADIKEQFKKETLLRDEHEEMRRYVEARIAAECPAAVALANAKDGGGAAGGGPSASKRTKVAGPEDDILYRAAELVKQYGSKRNEELLSNQMLVGIPEVDLGIETRMRNIEATEQKKVELLKKGAIPKPVNSWQPLMEEEIEE